jgi:hypothetical protein
MADDGSCLSFSDRKVAERYTSKLDDKRDEYEKFGRWTGLNKKQ